VDPTLSSDRTVLLRAAKSNETGGSICTSNDSVLRGGPILVTYGCFTSEKYMSPPFDRNTPVALAEFGDNIQRCLWGGGTLESYPRVSSVYDLCPGENSGKGFADSRDCQREIIVPCIPIYGFL